MSFTISLFSGVAVQKNIRDTQAWERNKKKDRSDPNYTPFNL